MAAASGGQAVVPFSRAVRFCSLLRDFGAIRRDGHIMTMVDDDYGENNENDGDNGDDDDGGQRRW